MSIGSAGEMDREIEREECSGKAGGIRMEMGEAEMEGDG